MTCPMRETMTICKERTNRPIVCNATHTHMQAHTHAATKAKQSFRLHAGVPGGLCGRVWEGGRKS